jgi:hypothetical protein
MPPNSITIGETDEVGTPTATYVYSPMSSPATLSVKSADETASGRVDIILVRGRELPQLIYECPEFPSSALPKVGGGAARQWLVFVCALTCPSESIESFEAVKS